MFTQIDHVGVAVDDLEAAVAFYDGPLGLREVHRETSLEQSLEVVLLEVGEGHVELLRPLSADGPVGRFLQRQGPGLHHIAYRVDDIVKVLAELQQAGVRLIDRSPRTGVQGSRVAFVNPRSSNGALTELVEPGS